MTVVCDVLFLSIHVTDSMCWMNRTSSVPKSVLHYELDKGKYLDPETSFTQSCFPNKKTDVWWELNCLFSLDGKEVQRWFDVNTTNLYVSKAPHRFSWIWLSPMWANHIVGVVLFTNKLSWYMNLKYSAEHGPREYSLKDWSRKLITQPTLT